MDIKDIIKKYIPTKEFINYGYYMNIQKYYQIAKINDNVNYTKNDDPSIKIFSANYHNKLYSFDYYKTVDNDNNIIFIKRINSTIKKNEYSCNYHCAMLSYYNKDNLFIKIMEYSDDCIKIDNKQNNDIVNGSILIKLIIKFAKINKFKNIILDDKSFYTCNKNKNDKIVYELKYVHTLTKGIPYYNKFGFIFNDTKNQEKLEYNKNRMNGLMINNISLDMLIYLIVKIIIDKSYQKVYNYNFIQDIYLIMQLYYKHTNNNSKLMDFFNDLTYNHCHIMAIIHLDLFESLGLQIYNKNEMILEL